MCTGDSDIEVYSVEGILLSDPGFLLKAGDDNMYRCIESRKYGPAFFTFSKIKTEGLVIVCCRGQTGSLEQQVQFFFLDIFFRIETSFRITVF